MSPNPTFEEVSPINNVIEIPAPDLPAELRSMLAIAAEGVSVNVNGRITDLVAIRPDATPDEGARLASRILLEVR